MTERAYKFRFYPNETMQAQLACEFGHARFVYNWALDMRSKAYARRGESINSVGISKILTQLKKTSRYDWLTQASATCLGQKLRDLDSAFSNFFNAKTSAKYPRFKKKTHQHSVRYQDIVYDQHKLIIPKLGNITQCVRWSRRPTGTPKMATISRVPSGKYYVSFVVDEIIQPKPKTKFSVGVDLGVKNVMTTSDGTKSGAPKFTYKLADQLDRAMRRLSRKTKGSNRWHKQRVRVALTHEKIANQRSNFIHGLTSMLVNDYDFIAAETLQVKNMMKNHKLAKAIADSAMGEVLRQLEYKCRWYGKAFFQVSTWFASTQTCSACHEKHPMPLGKDVFRCECGHTMNRDINAAINILIEAVRVLWGVGSADAMYVEGRTTVCTEVMCQQARPVKREDELNFPNECNGNAVA